MQCYLMYVKEALGQLNIWLHKFSPFVCVVLLGYQLPWNSKQIVDIVFHNFMFQEKW